MLYFLILHTFSPNSGDKLVFYKRKRNFFKNARNFSFSVRYPTRRQTLGANITSIKLYVLQTSKVGQAVIRQGGVGYRNVTMDVTSYNTTQCRYTVRIYGVNKHKWVIFHSRAISDNMVLLSGISSSSCCLCTRHNWNKWNFAWNCIFIYSVDFTYSFIMIIFCLCDLTTQTRQWDKGIKAIALCRNFKL